MSIAQRIGCVVLGLVLLCSGSGLGAAEDSPVAAQVRKAFDAAYAEYVEAERMSSHNLDYDERTVKAMCAIAELGPRALPFLMAKAEETGDFTLNYSIFLITRKQSGRSEVHLDGSQALLQADVAWWKAGRGLTKKRFAALLSDLKAAQRKEDHTGERQKIDTISRLGTAALPDVLREVLAGNTDLIPLASKMSQRLVTIGRLGPPEFDETASVSQIAEWWQANREKWLLPFPNKQPVAKAEIGGEARPGEKVRLDGSKSADADGDDLEYRWTQTEGPAVTFADAASSVTTFLAPRVTAPTALTFQLTVDDGSPAETILTCETGRSEPATVHVIVRPAP